MKLNVMLTRAILVIIKLSLDLNWTTTISLEGIKYNIVSVITVIIHNYSKIVVTQKLFLKLCIINSGIENFAFPLEVSSLFHTITSSFYPFYFFIKEKMTRFSNLLWVIPPVISVVPSIYFFLFKENFIFLLISS